MNIFRRGFNNWAYKKNSGKIYWEKVISSSIVLIALISFMIYNQGRVDERKVERDKFPRYTIGLTLGSYNNVRGAKTIKYKYFVNGKLFIEWGSYPVLIDTVAVDGGKYFVKFSALNPANAEILFDNPVPDNVKNVPDSGLNNLPLNSR